MKVTNELVPTPQPDEKALPSVLGFLLKTHTSQMAHGAPNTKDFNQSIQRQRRETRAAARILPVQGRYRHQHHQRHQHLLLRMGHCNLLSNISITNHTNRGPTARSARSARIAIIQKGDSLSSELDRSHHCFSSKNLSIQRHRPRNSQNH